MIAAVGEAVCLIIGVAFCLLAAVGVLRMPDLYTRMQASTKAGTLGIVFIVASVGFHFGDPLTALEATLIIGFLFFTAPIASHLIGRAGYVMRARQWQGSVLDELAPDIEATEAARDEADRRAGRE